MLRREEEIIVFLGPSLPVEDARAILPATYLPPAEQGDLLGAVLDLQPRVIALLDGVFLSRPSVWHREILYALSRGIHVFGASSMGALRAAELAAFGMQGVGVIFERFATGVYLDDDEVALVHHGSDQGFRPLSEPMVNVRETLARALRDEVILADEHDALVALAKDLYFAERSRPALFRAAAAQQLLPPDSALRRYFEEHYVDLKRQDAVALLENVAQLPEDLEPFTPAFDFSSNRLFQTLLHRDAALYEHGAKIARGDVSTYFALHDNRFDYYNFNAMNRALVQLLAGLLDVRVGPDEVAAERRRFKLKHGLLRDGQFEQWLRDNHLDAGAFEALLQQRAVCRRMHHWLWLKHGRLGSVGLLTEELLLTNTYLDTLRKASFQQQLLDSHAPFLIEAEDGQEMSVRELMREHLQHTGIALDVHYASWFKEANFSSPSALAYELIRSRNAREALLRMFEPPEPAVP